MFKLPPTRDDLREAFKNSDMANRVQNLDWLSEDMKKLYLDLMVESFCDGANHASRLANLNEALRRSREEN